MQLRTWLVVVYFPQNAAPRLPLSYFQCILLVNTLETDLITIDCFGCKENNSVLYLYLLTLGILL